MSEKQKFLECSESIVSKTPIWSLFLRDSSGEFAKCRKCQKVLKTAGKSTSGLHKHRSSMHADLNLKRPAVENMNPLEKRRNIESLTNPSSITNYFVTSDNSLDAVLARMTAVDGLPFSIFITSTEMRKSLLARGFDLPKSQRTIRDMVMQYGNFIRQKHKKDFQKFKAEGKRFSLTFDEWTSNKNRRYLNVNVHINNQFWNLGLARVLGSLPAESCIKLLQEILESFGLKFEDIVCITTDGASVMIKVGKLLSCKHQLCLAHAVHLAVLDILYKKPKHKSIQDENEDDSEFEDENDSSGLQIVGEGDVLMEMTDSIHPLIVKIRKIVKFFRKSPTQNDLLQKHVKEHFGKELQLILDVKTRWNSLFSMLQRFHKIKNCILKS